jgi:ribosomal protein S27AE
MAIQNQGKPFDDDAILLKNNGPAHGTACCKCGYKFFWDALDELNMVFDDSLMRLRVICPSCGRMETVGPHADFGGKSMHPNRIAEYL